MLADHAQDPDPLVGEEAGGLAPRFEDEEERRPRLPDPRHRDRAPLAGAGLPRVWGDRKVHGRVHRLRVHHRLDRAGLGEIVHVEGQPALGDPLLGERSIPRLPLAHGLEVPGVLRAAREGVEPRLVALQDLAGRSENGAQNLRDVGLEVLEIPLVAGEELSLHRDQMGEAPVEKAASSVPVGSRGADQLRPGNVVRRREQERLAGRENPVARERLSVSLEPIDLLENARLEEPFGHLLGKLVAAIVLDPRQRQLNQALPVFGRGLVERERGEESRADAVWVVHSPRSRMRARGGPGTDANYITYRRLVGIWPPPTLPRFRPLTPFWPCIWRARVLPSLSVAGVPAHGKGAHGFHRSNHGVTRPIPGARRPAMVRRHHSPEVASVGASGAV